VTLIVLYLSIYDPALNLASMLNFPFVLAYAVVQRGREISIRLAIGAEPATIRSLFLRQGLLLMSIGGAIGLLAARALSPWIVALLFGVQPFDVLTYGFSGVLILTAALAASYVPARRAASLNPIEALRAE
jgi:ABC-type lipoprotein release transport system permease subunit